jgi:hypothetical protein
MHTRRAESGQIMPMVALLMVVILGMAAFALDGSNIYSQHRRMQADLDVAVKLAGAKMFNFSPGDPVYSTIATQAITSAALVLAQDGYANNLATATYPSSRFTLQANGGLCGSDAGIVLCTPSRSGPFAGRYDTVDGTMGQDVGGFFGGVLGLGRVHISVRAVAEHGGFSEPYAIIGLDPNPNDCGIVVQNTAATLITDGSIHSNSQSCIKNGTAVITGTSESVAPTVNSNGDPILGSAGTTNGGASIITNPYSISVPQPVTDTAITICQSSCTYTSFTDASAPAWLKDPTCLSNLQSVTSVSNAPPAGVTYYLPPDAPGDYPPYGHTAYVDGFQQSTGEYDFLPHCDQSLTLSASPPISPTPAIYYFTGHTYDMKVSGQATVNSFNSVFVLSNDNTTLIDQTGSTNGSTSHIKWVLNSPLSGPFKGMAIYEDQPCTATHNLTIVGGSNSLINGIVDAGCANVTVSGNSQDVPFINGMLIGWQVTLAGDGTAIVNYDPSGAPPDKGSVLVE